MPTRPVDAATESPHANDTAQDSPGYVLPAAKLILKTVVEVSDVFPPLKSAAAGLKLIVEHVEVSHCPVCIAGTAHLLMQLAEDNHTDLEHLIQRIEQLRKTLTLDQDEPEESRRAVLSRYVLHRSSH